MADHKRQHYVPRCHFKPFSVDEKGDAINLFNVGNKKLVYCAPIKGQCARDYLYGEDLKLEKALQSIEGEYARVVRVVQNGPKHLTGHDIEALRFFATIQRFRTETALRREQEAYAGMDNAIFDGRAASADHRIALPDDREIMCDSVEMGVSISKVMQDLKACVAINQTKHEFITSDDPAVFTSRYYIQRLRSTNFGMISSGAMLALPLSPRHLILFYDGNVYTIPEKQCHSVPITKTSDVFALNELQYIKASKNLYFSDRSSAERIKGEFCNAEPRRPKSWFTFNIFVPDTVDSLGCQRYRRARDEERTTSLQTLIAMSSLYPEPTNWLSKLQYRTAPRTYSNGSAAGHVRKREWLNGGLDRDLRRVRPSSRRLA